jgi:autotransporter-associated beta strand protein
MPRSRTARTAVFVAAAAAVSATCMIRSAAAATAYWDINGTNADAIDSGTTAVGTWDAAATNLNWNPLADGTGTTAGWVADDTAVFSAGSLATGAYTVTVSGVPSVGGMTVEEGNVTLGGTFSATLGISIPSGGTTVDTQTATTQLTLPGFQGSGPLVKTGPGTLRLTTANNTTVATMSGGMTINQGVVLLDKNQGTGSASSAITLNGGTLKQNNAGT